MSYDPLKYDDAPDPLTFKDYVQIGWWILGLWKFIDLLYYFIFRHFSIHWLN